MTDREPWFDDRFLVVYRVGVDWYAVGPFGSEDEAASWASDHVSGREIMLLRAPQDWLR